VARSARRSRLHRPLRAAVSALAVALALGSAIVAPAATAATPSKVSLVDIEADLMCVACHEALNVAQSPEAFSERDYIRHLIAQGLSKPQILRQMVAQYGPSVLGKPPAHGFNLTVYVLPPLIVVLGAIGLAFALPRWRRRTRAARANAPPVTKLDPRDAARLDEDLARHPG
jgi:cytochrome c-type biogenesis protein CcmH